MLWHCFCDWDKLQLAAHRSGYIRLTYWHQLVNTSFTFVVTVFCSFLAEQSKKGGVLSPEPERYAHGCGQTDDPLPPEVQRFVQTFSAPLTFSSVTEIKVAFTFVEFGKTPF